MRQLWPKRPFLSGFLSFVALLGLGLISQAGAPTSDSGVTVHADISLVFYNRFNSPSEVVPRPATECFQRVHSGLLGLAGELWDVSLSYNWCDTVTSSVSEHTLTPYVLSAGLWTSENTRFECDAIVVQDIRRGRSVLRSVDAVVGYHPPGKLQIEMAAVVRCESVGEGWVTTIAPRASVGANLGPATVGLSIDSLEPVDYGLLGFGRHVVSLRARVPVWGGKMVSIGLNRILSGDVHASAGSTWLDFRIDMGHLGQVSLQR